MKIKTTTSMLHNIEKAQLSYNVIELINLIAFYSHYHIYSLPPTSASSCMPSASNTKIDSFFDNKIIYYSNSFESS